MSKIYVGSGKKHPSYDLITLDVCLSDIPKEHITKSQKNGKSYVKLKVSARKSPDDRGNTHSLEVDTWKPEPKQTAPKDDTDDLPF